MRKTKRFLAFSLAAAMVVTSFSGGAVRNANAAGAEATETEASKRLVDWNEPDAESKDKVEGSVYTKVISYSGVQISTNTSISVSSTLLKRNDINIRKAFGGGTSDAVSSPQYEYKWYKLNASGVREEIADESSNSFYLDYSDRQNDQTEKTFICEMSLSSIKVGNVTKNTKDDLVEGYTANDCALTYQVIYKYTGPSAATIADGTYMLEDYFSGTQCVNDEVKGITYSSLEDRKRISDMSELGADVSNAKIAYKWVAFSGEEKKEVKSSENANSIPVFNATPQQTFDSGDTKTIDYYLCYIQLKYGEQVLKAATKRYNMLFSPLSIISPESDVTTRSSRLNGSQTFVVDAEADKDTCDGVDYQWYSVAKDGTQTALKEEITNTLKVRVTDYDISYKCVVSAKLKKDMAGVKPVPQERIFKAEPLSGYKIKDISSRRTKLGIGEKKTLLIDAEVDNGYALKYSWSRKKKNDSNSAEEVLAQTAAIDVAPTVAADFDYNYILKVEVEKAGAATDEKYQYTFSLSEYVELDVDTNKGDVYTERGGNVSLYVKTAVNGTYAIEKVWYKEIARAAYTSQYDSGSGKYTDVFEDSTFNPPANDLCVDVYDKDGDGNYKQYHVYYQKIVSGVSADMSTLDLAGKNGDADVDIRGNYLCRISLSRQENGTPYPVDTLDYEFAVKYDSELTAHAKSRTVEALPATAAKLEVIAANKNVTMYPISYKWEKLNTSTGVYEEVKTNGVAETGAVLTVASVTAESYGDYRVTVSDDTAKKVVNIKLVKKAVEYVAYTPDTSSFEKAIGAQVDLKVDLNLTNGTSVYYEWYRSERIYNSNSSYDYDNVDWEILNVTANTYSFTVANDRDYTTYKCIATFKTTDDNGNSVSESHTFKFKIVKPYSFGLERLTPELQYKKIGSSADYSVRLVSGNSGIEGEVKYQWYRSVLNGNKYVYEKIENATNASYHVDVMTVNDFGKIKCEAAYTDVSGEELKTDISFITYLFTEASLKKNNVTQKVILGSNVTMKPDIANPANEELTYQWYRYSKNVDEDDNDKSVSYGSKEIIHGATGNAYTVNEISADEITRYECEILCGGSLVMSYKVTLTEDVDSGKITIEYAEGFEKELEAVLGNSAEMAVTAKSSKNLELRYQWYKGSVAIGGAVSSSYKIDKITPDKYGSYSCKVTDSEGNTASLKFNLVQTTKLEVVNDAYNVTDTIGYETKIGGTVKLSAMSTTIDSNYKEYYRWWHVDDDGVYKLLYGQTNSSLTLSNVTEDTLGYYICNVYDSVGKGSITLTYYVYVDTGLVIKPSAKNVLANADGLARMSINATANSGEKITYRWSKLKTVKKGDAEYDDELDEDGTGEYSAYVDIAGSTGDTFNIAKVSKEDYGKYRCLVKTKGEALAVNFELYPSYTMKSSRKFAEQGDSIKLNAVIENPAADVGYTYKWYAQEPATGTYREMTSTSNSCTANAPKYMQSDVSGYMTVGYRCVIEDKNAKDEEDKRIKVIQTYVNVLPDVTYSTKMPETNHPFDTAYDIKGYRNKGAKSLTVTFQKVELDEDEILYVIDGTGDYIAYNYSGLHTVKVNGEKAIFLINGNTKAKSYGYKVASIKKTVAATNSSASGKKLPKKGAKYTTGNVTYKVTKSSKKNGTVTVSGVKSKKLKKATVKDSVKINGYTFKVTAIAANAFKGCKKLTSVTIGKNVKSIGANAFANDKKLRTIKIKGTGLKSVGKKAFKGVSKAAKASVPKKKKKAYKKLLKKGNYKGKVK